MKKHLYSQQCKIHKKTQRTKCSTINILSRNVFQEKFEVQREMYKLAQMYKHVYNIAHHTLKPSPPIVDAKRC